MRNEITVILPETVETHRGQIRGLAGMVEDDRYCIDIVTQIAAARAACAGSRKRSCVIMSRIAWSMRLRPATRWTSGARSPEADGRGQPRRPMIGRGTVNEPSPARRIGPPENASKQTVYLAGRCEVRGRRLFTALIRAFAYTAGQLKRRAAVSPCSRSIIALSRLTISIWCCSRSHHLHPRL